MKQSQLHQVLGCLYATANYDLVNEFMVLSGKLPAVDYPPAGLSPEALRWWKTHVFPKYGKAIRKSANPWGMAAKIMQFSCKKHGKQCYRAK